MFEIKGVYYEDNGNGLTVCGLSESWDKDDLTLTDEVKGLPVTRIKAYAFQNVAELKKVSIPRSVDFIEAFAFYKCMNLEDVTFFRKRDASPIKIEQQAFGGCTNLKHVRGAARLELAGDYVFFGCTSLENMPTGIYGTIRAGTFMKCPSMRTMFMQHVTAVEQSAFDSNHGVETMVVIQDFKYDEEFIQLMKNVKFLCVRKSTMADLIYDGYNVVLTAK